jgi:uncharacterized ferredoxin-like protein
MLYNERETRHFTLRYTRDVFAIPVSASSKNPFFDRKPKEG